MSFIFIEKLNLSMQVDYIKQVILLVPHRLPYCECIAVFQTLLARKVDVDIEKTATRLYSHNLDVDLVNSRKLMALSGKEHIFQMTALGRKALVEQLKKGCLSPETLILKKGARVIFTKNNYERGFVNGTLGEIVAFNEDGIPMVLTKQHRKSAHDLLSWDYLK